MKKLLLGLLLMTGFIAKAQVYNNEWIDYSKTYYKFKVGKTGLYRISQSVLSAAGLGSTSADYFQLWRNGKQIPIYTSVATGSFSASDYIEFWGEMNDGRPDKELYRDPNWQLNDKWSLETDTAAYFLTVNTDPSSNLRLQTAANNVSGTSLTPDTYFMYIVGKYFRDKLNPGYAVNVGQYMYSSSYDKGEGWSSNDVYTSFSNCAPTYGSNVFTFANLNVYKGSGAPAPKFKIAISGNQINQRRYLAKINSDSVSGNVVDFFNYIVDSTSFSVNTLSGNLDTVSIFNYTTAFSTGCPVSDRMTVHKYEITYPRTFDFNGQSNFEFALTGSAVGNYLQITNFASGTSTPVLYDLTNGKRYVADLSGAPMLKFVLDPSLTARSLVLVNEDVSNVNSISSLEVRNFSNYTSASNQGDYLIISNGILFAASDGTNPVDEYRKYRSSAPGGSYNAKIYLVDQIIDQFGFGIKKNPAAVRNFIRYARNNYAITPKHVFIIGRGMTYPYERVYESYPDIDRLDIVPTYGSPASDVLLGADPGSSLSLTSIGRLSAITPDEVGVYLKKVKEYELVQATSSPYIADRDWMKNFVHIVGASDDALDSLLSQDLNDYKAIIVDTLFGAKVTTFNKTSVDAVSQLNSSAINDLFQQGISVITYFGHSSATTLEFNLDNPQNYNNYKKYPLFIAMGCNAGAFFDYNNTRLQTAETISESYVLAPNRGTIGFIASTHFGIVPYLNIWAERAYKQISYKSYGKTIGEILKATAADVFNYTTQQDFYARCNTEQTEYNGDPAIRLNTESKPDFAIEDSMVKIDPVFLSVADHSFNVTANFLNLGKATSAPVVLEIKRKLPDSSVVVIRRDTIPGIRYSASITINIPINDPAKEKGLNKIIVTVDPDNNVDELFETNNSVTKDVTIFDQEIRPIYPYEYAIINRQNIKLSASTANPFDSLKQYVMELDTTELFNSPFKISKTINSVGGLLEFDPGITFTNGTTYYWRTALMSLSATPKWNNSSFTYLNNYQLGFNQSHRYQFLKSSYDQIVYNTQTDSLRFDSVTNNVFIRNAVFPTGSDQTYDFLISVNDQTSIFGGCYYDELMFNVFDPITMKPWKNIYSGGTGLYNSLVSQCASGRDYNFEFALGTQASRKNIMDFLDLVPDGYYVVVRSNTNPNYSANTYASTWLQDEATFGVNNSVYTKLLNQGFADIDSFNRQRSWIFMYKKNRPAEFQAKSVFSFSQFDKITLSASIRSVDSIGYIKSPLFGPAKSWKEMQWGGFSAEQNSSDIAKVSILGYSSTGSIDTLMSNIPSSQLTTNISSIDAIKYPYLQMYMTNFDNVNFTPYQLKYWRLTASPAPEGAIAPNIFFAKKDTVDVAEPMDFKLAFKNVSDANFDSLKTKIIVTDNNNVSHVLPTFKQRPLIAGDTVHIRSSIDTRQFVGKNSLYVEINPDYDQPEQYHFNNFIYSSFFVRKDTLNPLLDVTFDNVHILNHDIVSSKPNILIKLKDESKWYTLDNPSILKVQIRYPNGTLHDYNFGTDTLQFMPAVQQVPTANNTASVVFKPYFLEDGEYELIVSGKDMSQNAIPLQYRIAFDVYNSPMISNVMNYPNPFTTSTAFVFTLTGSEVPQNMKIQILTVTGKIVREITKEELGPLHIGRNITEFKWDGTDQYGQKLGNGVYLYHVMTNLNGKSLDKFKSQEDNTDKYFNKGYGKMYLMR